MEQRLRDVAGWERQLEETVGGLVDAVKRGDEDAEWVVKEALKTLLRSKLV